MTWSHIAIYPSPSPFQKERGDWYFLLIKSQRIHLLSNSLPGWKGVREKVKCDAEPSHPMTSATNADSSSDQVTIVTHGAITNLPFLLLLFRTNVLLLVF